MFENLIHNIDKLKIFINYDSAASYNRTDGINGVREKDFSSSSVPKDFYGSSKYTIAKRVLQTDKSYNLRIFNCFGVNETSERMIKSNINRYIDKQELVIHTNKIMDFFDIDDLVKVTQHYIDNYDDNLPKDLNLCYKQKTSLIDVVNMINTLDTYRVGVKVENYNTDFNYYGHSDYLEHLPIELDGLYCGIQKMFIYLKEKK
jgi:dTDP-4-dehydrorhamnose reductase